MSGSEANPWLPISAQDYEGHMGPDHADQLRPLRDVFADVYHTIRPPRLALLGCATGNGLEHVDPALTKSAVAIDIHPEFVAVTKERYGKALGAALEVRCEDLTSCVLPSGAFDLVHAALVFEHLDARALVPRIANWVAAGGVCAVVLQVESSGAPGRRSSRPLRMAASQGSRTPCTRRPRRRSRLCSSARVCASGGSGPYPSAAESDSTSANTEGAPSLVPVRKVPSMRELSIILALLRRKIRVSGSEITRLLAVGRGFTELRARVPLVFSVDSHFRTRTSLADMRICFFGDSFVNGTGDDDGLGWVGRVVARARQGGRDVTAYNLGIRRDTSADVAARWMRDARLRLPHERDCRLVSSFGANDCMTNGEDGERVSAR